MSLLFIIAPAMSDTPTESTPNASRARKRLPIANLIAGLLALVMFGLAFQNWRSSDRLVEAFRPTDTPTNTPLPVTPTITPTLTQPAAVNTNTPTPTETPLPTNTPTPIPLATPLPPYTHTISSGEVLINVALRYNVTIGSIIDVNDGLTARSLSVGQQIRVPRPTATPPLQPVDIEVNGEPAVADPADCVQHEIAQNDTIFGIALRYNVTIDALLKMNRLSENALLGIGDTVCIPTIIFNAKAISLNSDLLRRTSAEIRQPTLLYPADAAAVTAVPLTLQWIAERDLALDEHYMIEVTQLDDAYARPIRAFTRQTSWQLTDGNVGRYQWRVSFVTLTGNGSAVTYAWNGPVTERTFILATSN